MGHLFLISKSRLASADVHAFVNHHRVNGDYLSARDHLCHMHRHIGFSAGSGAENYYRGMCHDTESNGTRTLWVGTCVISTSSPFRKCGAA